MKKLLLIVAGLGCITAQGALQAAEQPQAGGASAQILALPGFTAGQSAAMAQLQAVDRAAAEGGRRMDNDRSAAQGETAAAGSAGSGAYSLVKGHEHGVLDSTDADINKSIARKLAERRAKPLTGEEKEDAAVATAGGALGLGLGAYVFATLGTVAAANVVGAAIIGAVFVAAGAYCLYDAAKRWLGGTRVNEAPAS